MKRNEMKVKLNSWKIFKQYLNTKEWIYYAFFHFLFENNKQLKNHLLLNANIHNKYHTSQKHKKFFEIFNMWNEWILEIRNWWVLFDECRLPFFIWYIWKKIISDCNNDLKLAKDEELKINLNNNDNIWFYCQNKYLIIMNWLLSLWKTWLIYFLKEYWIFVQYIIEEVKDLNQELNNFLEYPFHLLIFKSYYLLEQFILNNKIFSQNEIEQIHYFHKLIKKDIVKKKLSITWIKIEERNLQRRESENYNKIIEKLKIFE